MSRDETGEGPVEEARRGVSRRGLLGGAAAGGIGLAAALLQAARAEEAAAGTLPQAEVPTGLVFALEVEGMTGYFTECSGIGSEHEVVESKVSQDRSVILKTPGRLKWNDIVLKRGITSNMDLWEWRKMMEDGKSQEARKDGAIVVYDQELAEVARWDFVNAWPSKISAGHSKFLSDDVMILEDLVLIPGAIQRVR